MQANQVPEPLRERLGAEATSGLLDLFETAKLEWGGDVMRLSTDRFERRLTEECSKIRVEMAHLQSGLRQEMQVMGGGLRQEIQNLRQEMQAMGAGLRQDIATQRVEILKWAFLFWVGQFFAVASLIVVLNKYLRPAG